MDREYQGTWLYQDYIIKCSPGIGHTRLRKVVAPSFVSYSRWIWHKGETVPATFSSTNLKHVPQDTPAVDCLHPWSFSSVKSPLCDMAYSYCHFLWPSLPLCLDLSRIQPVLEWFSISSNSLKSSLTNYSNIYCFSVNWVTSN